MDNQLRDLNTALRQHSDALGRLAQRLRAAEERCNQSFTSQEQLLSRIEKLENFVVRSDADRRRNEDQSLNQISQIRAKIDEVNNTVSRNSRVSQQIGEDIEHLKSKQHDSSNNNSKSRSNNNDMQLSSDSRLEARLATIESKLAGQGGVKALIAKNNQKHEEEGLKDFVSKLEKNIISQNERFNETINTIKSKIKITSEELIKMNQVITEKNKNFESFKNSQMSKSQINYSIEKSVKNGLIELMEEISGSNKRQYGDLISKINKVEAQIKGQILNFKKQQDQLDKIDMLETKNQKYNEELKAIQLGCEELSNDFAKFSKSGGGGGGSGGSGGGQVSSLLKELQNSEDKDKVNERLVNLSSQIKNLEKKLDKYKITESKLIKGYLGIKIQSGP